MVEIYFRFPCIFQQRVSFPCGQVQSVGIRAFVGKDGLHFVFLFVIYDIRRWR